jgi:hypothetical protein
MLRVFYGTLSWIFCPTGMDPEGLSTGVMALLRKTARRRYIMGTVKKFTEESKKLCEKNHKHLILQ